MANSPLKELSDLDLALPEPGKATPKERIQSAKAANDIYEALRRGDEPSAINRARIQGMLDGSPPYNEAQLRASGQASRTNLNFGEAEKFLEGAMSAYVDLVNSVENLVKIETAYGEPSQRVEWSRIMSEEFSYQLRTWSRFHFEYLNLCNHFIGHGVGTVSYTHLTLPTNREV